MTGMLRRMGRLRPPGPGGYLFLGSSDLDSDEGLDSGESDHESAGDLMVADEASASASAASHPAPPVATLVRLLPPAAPAPAATVAPAPAATAAPGPVAAATGTPAAPPAAPKRRARPKPKPTLKTYHGIEKSIMNHSLLNIGFGGTATVYFNDVNQRNVVRDAVQRIQDQYFDLYSPKDRHQDWFV